VTATGDRAERPAILPQGEHRAARYPKTPRRQRIGSAAAIAACIAAAAVLTTDDQSARDVPRITVPDKPAAGRYFDIEANKAATMRALGRDIAGRRANRTMPGP